MALTSEQYKYLLVRRMQRHVATSSESQRYYYLNFVGKLLDDSVTVTEASYNEFNALLEQEMALCAEKGYYLAGNIPSSDINDGALLLQQSMESIGIQMTAEQDSSGIGYTFTFTKPNDEVMTLIFDGGDTIYIFPGGRMEYGYAHYAAPYYRIPEAGAPGLDEIGTQKCGKNLYWEYDSATATVTVSGSGSYSIAIKREEQIGSGAYTTIVLGPDVSAIGEKIAFDGLTIMVLLRPENAEMDINTSFNVGGGTCATVRYPMTVYTDCTAAIATLTEEPLSSSITVKSLSEWEG